MNGMNDWIEAAKNSSEEGGLRPSRALQEYKYSTSTECAEPPDHMGSI